MCTCEQRRGSNLKRTPPRALANLVDNFSDADKKCFNASDMIEAQLTSLDFGEDKSYVDSGATKHVSPNKSVQRVRLWRSSNLTQAN